MDTHRTGVDLVSDRIHLSQRSVAELLDLQEDLAGLGTLFLRRLDQRKDRAELRVERGVLRVGVPVRCKDNPLYQFWWTFARKNDSSCAGTHILPPNLYASDCCCSCCC